jgi:signal transduction histidine kinase
LSSRRLPGDSKANADTDCACGRLKKTGAIFNGPAIISAGCQHFATILVLLVRLVSVAVKKLAPAHIKLVRTALAAGILYAAGFIAIYFTVGFGSSIIAVIPVVIIAWSYGCLPGLIAGFMAAPVNIGMYSLLDENWFEKGIMTGTIVVGSITVTFIGGIIGRLRDVSRQLARSNEVLNAEIAERKRVEQELMLHRNHLDELVQEKTAALQTTNRQLLQSAKMASLGTLVAGIAHEINNPVNLITMNIPLVQDVWKDARPILRDACARNPGQTFGGLPRDYVYSKFDKLLADMGIAASRIVRIIDSLKSFSRQTKSGEKRAVSLNESVRNALTLSQTSMNKAGLKLEVDLHQGLVHIEADPQQVEQIVLNLIINAIEAIEHDHGRVGIRTGYDMSSAQVYLEVSDNGCGIDASIADHIFDPFFTSRQTRGGTGLGLSISYSLVREHGGTIAFENNPGGGTIFTVSFPSAEAQTVGSVSAEG